MRRVYLSAAAGDGVVRVGDELLDRIPIDFDIEVHPDPAPMTDIGAG